MSMPKVQIAHFDRFDISLLIISAFMAVIFLCLPQNRQCQAFPTKAFASFIIFMSRLTAESASSKIIAAAGGIYCDYFFSSVCFI